jgi:hypothetical protein
MLLTHFLTKPLTKQERGRKITYEAEKSLTRGKRGRIKSYEADYEGMCVSFKQPTSLVSALVTTLVHVVGS